MRRTRMQVLHRLTLGTLGNDIDRKDARAVLGSMAISPCIMNCRWGTPSCLRSMSMPPRLDSPLPLSVCPKSVSRCCSWDAQTAKEAARCQPWSLRWPAPVCRAERTWKHCGSIMLPVMGEGVRGSRRTVVLVLLSWRQCQCLSAAATSLQHHPQFIFNFSSFLLYLWSSLSTLLFLAPLPSWGWGRWWMNRWFQSLWVSRLLFLSVFPPPPSSLPPPLPLKMPWALICVLLSPPPSHKGAEFEIAQDEEEVGPALPVTCSPFTSPSQARGDPPVSLAVYWGKMHIF